MRNKPIQKPPSKWHAVSLVIQVTSCAAATQCRKARWLARDAPRLPLAECDRARICDCTFRHFEDRRSGMPRRSMNGRPSARNGLPPLEQRKSMGRRASDLR